MSSITSKTPNAAASAPSLRVRDPNYVERIRAAFGRQGFLRLIEGRVDEVAPGRCVIVADFRTALAQQNGFFHGGLIGTLADAAGACAASTLLASRQWLLTAEYKINFLAPAKGARLKAVGEVVRAGRTLSVSQVHLYGINEAGEEALCALATVTLAILEGEAPGVQKD
jgi:uncharacterized protein (TIGR00369 family)